MNQNNEAAPHATGSGHDKKTPDSTPTLEAVQQQLARFVECLFEPTDIIEIRRLKPGSGAASSWHLPDKVVAFARALLAENRSGANLYVGANPRTCHGDHSSASDCPGNKCGRCTRCVACARCLFVDLDHVTLDEGRFRLDETNLPTPTMTVATGGGVHFYWRLTEPLTDLALWTRYQKGLIAVLASDRAVHDAPRVMRLPGFLNLKYSPPRLCTIVEAHPERTYDLDEFADASTAKPVPRSASQDNGRCDGMLQPGTRHGTLLALSGAIHRHGAQPETLDEMLQVFNRKQCSPPKPAAEITALVKWIARKPRGTGVALPWRPFPIELLPQPLQSIVVEGAESLGVDPSMIALPCLAVCAASIGTARAVLVKRDWLEWPIFWPTVVLRSGATKSSALDLAVAPLREVQASRFREHDADLMEYERAKLEYEVNLTAWKRKTKDRGEPLEKPEPPTCTRHLVSDTTCEALAPMLQANPRGVLLCRDELSGWVRSFDQYKARGRGADLSNWLEAHRCGPWTVDRKHAPTIHVPRVAISVCGTVTPGVLKRLLTAEYFESGFVARLLLAEPPVRTKQWTDRTVSDSTEKAYARVVHDLLSLRHDRGPDGQAKVRVLGIARPAQEFWHNWYNEFGQRQAAASGDLASALSKLEGTAVRFALVFRLVRWATSPNDEEGPIQLEDVDAGCRLSEWFADEAERLYALWHRDDDVGDDASRERAELLRYIRTKGGRITGRNLQRGPRQYRDPDAASRALQELVAAGLGVWKPVTSGEAGGRPACVFVLLGARGDITPESPEESEVMSPVASDSAPENNVDGTPPGWDAEAWQRACEMSTEGNPELGADGG